MIQKLSIRDDTVLVCFGGRSRDRLEDVGAVCEWSTYCEPGRLSDITRQYTSMDGLLFHVLTNAQRSKNTTPEGSSTKT